MVGTKKLAPLRVGPYKILEVVNSNAYKLALVRFWFSFVDCVLVYRYAYVFVWLCLDMHVVCVVLLCIGYDSRYAVSSTHWAALQHTLGPPVL